MDSLISRLKKCLTDGRTQAGLARASGVKPSSVSAWLSGKTKRIEGANLLRAAQYLGVRPEWLATGAGPMRPDEHRVSEPPADYLIQPIHARPLVKAICDLAERIDDIGLMKLQGYATCLLADHPLVKAKRA